VNIIGKIKTTSKQKRNKLRIIISLLFFVLVSGSPVIAEINLGSIVNVNDLVIHKGNEGTYQISFFTIGSQKIYVTIESEYSDELEIDISPKKFVLAPEITQNPSECLDCDWFVLGDGKTYVRTQPVRIRVRVPNAIQKNTYKIKLTAIASTKESKDNKGITQNLVQAREFILTTRVPGSISQSPEVGKKPVETLEIEKTEYTPTTVESTKSESKKTEEIFKEKIPTGFIVLPKKTDTTKIIWLLVISIVILLTIIIVIKKMRSSVVKKQRLYRYV